MQRRRSVTRFSSARDPVTSASDRLPRETGWWSSELYKSQSSRLVNSVGYSFPSRWLLVALSLPLPWIPKLPALRLLFPVRLVCQRASRQLRCALSGKQAAGSGVTPPPNFASRRVTMATRPQRTPAGSAACVIQTDKWTEREQAERGGICLIYPPPPPPASAASSLADPRPKHAAAGLSCHCFPYRPPPFRAFGFVWQAGGFCRRPPRGGAPSCLLPSAITQFWKRPVTR